MCVKFVFRGIKEFLVHMIANILDGTGGGGWCWKLREGLFGKSRLENVTFIYLNKYFVCVCVFVERSFN